MEKRWYAELALNWMPITDRKMRNGFLSIRTKFQRSFNDTIWFLPERSGSLPAAAALSRPSVGMVSAGACTSFGSAVAGALAIVWFVPENRFIPRYKRGFSFVAIPCSNLQSSFRFHLAVQRVWHIFCYQALLFPM